jgi:hypothetical protein
MEEESKKADNNDTGSGWFETEQIESFVGEMDNGGERKKLIVLHQCGNDKEALIGQLKLMIDGLESNFDWFAS